MINAILMLRSERQGFHITLSDIQNGALLASGGRVLVCVGVGQSLELARKNAYKIAESICFEGMQYRRDIAMRGIRFLDSQGL